MEANEVTELERAEPQMKEDEDHKGDEQGSEEPLQENQNRQHMWTDEHLNSLKKGL